VGSNTLEVVQPTLCVDLLNGTLDPQGLCILSFDAELGDNATTIATINETITIDAAEILQSLLNGKMLYSIQYMNIRF